MRSAFKVLFYVKKGSEKPNGNLPLMCRITVDGEIKQFSCKMDVPLRLWDVKTGRASGKSVEAQRINLAVDNHQPEDKSGHGNPVAQAGGDGEEYPPNHLVPLKQHTDGKRKEHHHDGRVGQYLPADRHRRNRHDRVGNLRTVRGNRPNGSGRDKGSLQKRSFERVRHQTPYPPVGQKQHGGLRPRNDSRPRFPHRIVRGCESAQSHS